MGGDECTYSWLYTLSESEVVDACVSGGETEACWHEARVISAENNIVKVRLLGQEPGRDAAVARLPRDIIQPPRTCTAVWKGNLVEGSTIDVRRRRDGGGKRQKCVVLKVEEAEDGERLLQLRVISNSRKANPGGGEADQAEGGGGEGEARDVWISEGVDAGSQARVPDSEQIDKRSRSRKGDGHVSQPGGNKNTNVGIGMVDDGNEKRTPSESRHAARRVKRVALVGSSGGGAAALGQFDAVSLLSLAKTELSEAGLQLSAVQFVACSEPLDTAAPDADTSLWVLDGDRGLVVAARGTLLEVNAAAKHQDARIAAALRAGVIGREISVTTNGARNGQAPLLPLHGLVAISCDVRQMNRQTFAAARDCGSPIVGTGGSSLGEAMAMGCLLVGSSGGSVATTNKSKVVSYTAGLASHFRLDYDARRALSLPLSWPSAFAGCLPASVGMMLLLRTWGLMLQHEDESSSSSSSSLSVGWLASEALLALPAVAGAVSAKQVSTMGDVATVAGIVAGCLCRENVLAALVAGTFAGYLCSTLTAACLSWGVPATSLSFYATIPSGIVSGMIVKRYLPVIQIIWALLASTRVLLDSITDTWAKAASGAMMGCLMCYGSKVGWYHRMFLPVIVLELAAGEGSVWGAIDLCALCMVAAGLCTAHLVRPSSRADIPLARRGLRINVCFGDFIEAAYPFMERCAWCNAGGYVGSGLSGAIVAVSGVSSSAYIPLPLAVATCNRPLWLAVASSAAFFPAFLSGVSRPLRRVSDNDDDDDDGGVLNKREGCLQ